MFMLIEATDAEAVERLLRGGAKEVIVAGAQRAEAQAESRAAAPEAHGGRVVEDVPAANWAPATDDQVPIEELWPALDEPDDEGVGMETDFRHEAPPDDSQDRGTPIDLQTLSANVRARTEKGAVASAQRHRAPLITVISGRGGVGKTTLVASMAAAAARAGLRAAVLDLDLMFGDLPAMLGADVPKGLELLVAHGGEGYIAECDVEGSAMRIGPGLTLWGPLDEPERAEFFGGPIEQLIDVLRGAADVIFADTSGFWGDAVAVAVASCDRCLMVGSGGVTSGESAARAIGLATRLGVPTTRMVSVFNRLGARGSGEEEALRFEMGASLRARKRIADGGDDVIGMVSFGHLDALMAGTGAFAQSVRSFTGEVLGELGCAIDPRLLEAAPSAPEARPRFRLPWTARAGERT